MMVLVVNSRLWPLGSRSPVLALRFSASGLNVPCLLNASRSTTSNEGLCTVNQVPKTMLLL